MDKKLISILACPLCKGQLEFNKSDYELICRFDRLAFPVKNDIPVMLEQEARPLGIEEYR